jgi:exopolysaccharide biosynthesis protein
VFFSSCSGLYLKRKNKVTSKQKSIIFWIIFLVIVAVICMMILSKYGTLSKDLRATQARNLASSLTSSSAANYTQRKSNSSSGISIKNCKDVTNITGNHLPTNYEITDQAVQPDAVIFCTLNGPGIASIQFSVIGIN